MPDKTGVETIREDVFFDAVSSESGGGRESMDFYRVILKYDENQKGGSVVISRGQRGGVQKLLNLVGPGLRGKIDLRRFWAFYGLIKYGFPWLIAMGLLVLSACVPPGNIPEEPPPVAKPSIPLPEKDDVAEAYRLYTASSLAIAEKDFGEASEYLARAVELDPSSAHLCVSLARVKRQMGDMDAAFARGLDCVRLHPQSAEAHAFVGDLHATDGDEEAAVEHYLEALRLGSTEEQRILLMLADLAAKAGRYLEAVEHLETILGKNPGHFVAQYFRGRVHLQLKEYQEAEACFMAALESRKKAVPVLFDLGTLYQVTGRRDEAVEVYERLLDLNPMDTAARERIITLYVELGKHELAEPHINSLKEVTERGAAQRQVVGLAYLQQERYEEAIQELEAIVAKNPGDAKSRHYLGTAYEEAGEIDQAISHFNDVAEGSQYYFNSRVHLALIYNDRGQTEQATEVLQQLRDAGERRSELYLILSTLLEQQGRYDEAETVVHEGLVYNQRNEELLFRLGVLFDRKGDKEACIDQMEMVLEVNPEHADALNYIGYTLAEMSKRLDEAERLIEKALSIKPDSGYIVDSLGWVYFKQKRYKEALQQLERAAVMVPEDPAVAEHLGDAYLKLNRTEKALFQYRKALELGHPDADSVRKKITDLKKLLKQ